MPSEKGADKMELARSSRFGGAWEVLSKKGVSSNDGVTLRQPSSQAVEQSEEATPRAYRGKDDFSEADC